MNLSNSQADQILLQRRIEKYLDQGYGQAFMKDHRVATMIQDVLLDSDNESYRLSAWVVMPNHIHLLATRFENYRLADIMQSLKEQCRKSRFELKLQIHYFAQGKQTSQTTRTVLDAGLL